MALNNLSQMNDIHNVDGKILDLVLTNYFSLEVTKSDYSITKIDQKHPPLLITMPEQTPHFLKPNLTPRYNFFKANYGIILENLNNINWLEEFKDCKNVNVMTSIFFRILNEIVDNNVTKTRPKNRKYPPWFSSALIKIIAEKENMRKKYAKHRNPRDRLVYELLRERSKKLISQCLQYYKRQIETNIYKNPKCFWHFIKERRGNETTIPVEMTYVGRHLKGFNSFIFFSKDDDDDDEEEEDEEVNSLKEYDESNN
ncbi:unnamed protein product [Euphydryas editha]|uniref:Translocon at the inner envelope membrane of chloroplasts 214 n=1 Tax=Euphydryas editha TaxID=104508 RepID=A0AAU9TRS2_EUPED|nr:unnamed protein product [Euphydryas editha]